MNIEIRPARANDTGPITDCLFSSAPELYTYLYTTTKWTPRAVLGREFESGRGYSGYQNVTVAPHRKRSRGHRLLLRRCGRQDPDERRPDQRSEYLRTPRRTPHLRPRTPYRQHPHSARKRRTLSVQLRRVPRIPIPRNRLPTPRLRHPIRPRQRLPCLRPRCRRQQSARPGPLREKKGWPSSKKKSSPTPTPVSPTHAKWNWSSNNS